MSIKKFFMKQYWRVGKVRQITGLVLGMLVLGAMFYKITPILQDWGFYGAITIATILFIVFLGVGYLYDVIGKLWNENIQVLVERNPYSYVPNDRYFMAEYPIYFLIITTLRELMKSKALPTKTMDDLALYIHRYYNFKANRNEDLQSAPEYSEAFMKDYPFVQQFEDKGKPSILSRMKKSLMIHIWRLQWVQTFTGLAQDVLIFGTLYIAIIFPHLTALPEGSFEVFVWGLFVISLPLYFGLISVGWYYDRKAQLWSEDWLVRKERDPYSYVPEPRMITHELPFLYGLIQFLHSIVSNLDIQSSHLEEVILYLDKYVNLSAKEDSDMAVSLNRRKELGRLFINSDQQEQIGD